MKRIGKNKLFKPSPIPDRADMNRELNEEWQELNDLIWKTVGCVAEKPPSPPDDQNNNRNDNSRAETSASNVSANTSTSVADLSYIWRDSQSSQSTDTSSSPPAAQEATTNSRRIYVSNIPFKFTNTDLQHLCQTIGPVVSAEVIYNERGSKGFGFVSFENEFYAQWAIKTLNGLVIDGRRIEVHPATPKEKAAAVKGKKKAEEEELKTLLLLHKLQRDFKLSDN